MNRIRKSVSLTEDDVILTSKQVENNNESEGAIYKPVLYSPIRRTSQSRLDEETKLFYERDQFE